MPKKPSLLVSLIPLITLIVLLCFNVVIFKDDSSYGANQMALMVAALVAGLIGVFHLGLDYKQLEQKVIDSIGVSLQAILILLVVGSLIGVWIFNGVVPSMIFYGIKLIHPSVFLPITLIICSIVSISTGSSWSTVGTVGIALIGIGQTLGIPEGMVAGAIVSGSYFGDKMSPLSDTTNLAPAMAGAELFEHIKHMVYTTGPAYIISLILFIILGFSYGGGNADTKQIEEVTTLIAKNFNVSLWLFTLPLFVILLVKKRVDALPALVAGVVLGVIYIFIFQQDLLARLSGGEFDLKKSYELITRVSYNGYESNVGHKMIDKLFSRGGMSSMLNTVWLIVMAMVFGGMMEVTGLLSRIADGILTGVKGVTSLVASTVGTAIFLNATTGDQYIAIVVTGRMFKEAYQKFNLKAKNLSRAVEDSATVTSVLVPWNSGGAYFATVMGVSTLTYLPFSFFNILCPIVSIAIAASGKTMERIEE